MTATLSDNKPDTATNRSLRRYHREVFFAANGFGPYTCSFCASEVTFDEVVVHHADHDHSNNAVGNLVATHGRCHQAHHASERRGQKRKPYNRTYVVTDEHRAAIKAGIARSRASKPKRVLSDETKAKMSAAQKGKKRTPEHQAKLTAALTGRVVSDEARANMSAAAKRRCAR